MRRRVRAAATRKAGDMHKWFLSCIGIFAMLCGAPDARAQYDPRTNLILEELQHLREAVDALTREVKELREGRPPVRPAPGPGDLRGSDHEALATVRFPEDPTPDALRKYIREINRISENQRSFSPRDPQVDMLMRVGPDRLDFLLQSMDRRSRGLGGYYHAREAIIQLAEDRHKDLILEYLPHNHDLAPVILRFGWEEEAKDILMEGLAAMPDYLPRDWIRAVIHLDDPETHPLLLAFLMHGRNKSQTYNVVSSHITEGLDEAVEEAWRQSRQNWDRRQMAPIAAEHGIREALDYMIGEMAETGSADERGMREWRPTIIRLTGFIGTTPDLIQWYEKHREQLEYEEESRRYVLPE